MHKATRLYNPVVDKVVEKRDEIVGNETVVCNRKTSYAVPYQTKS